MRVRQEIIQTAHKYNLKNIMRKYFFPVSQIIEMEHLEKFCIGVESDSNQDTGFSLSMIL